MPRHTQPSSMADAFELGELKLEDTNCAGIGSEEDRALRKKAAQTEKAWKGCGMAPGVEVWRIEQFKVVPWPRTQYGDFYEGDSYVVLHTEKSEGDVMVRNIYFWLGLGSTADEQGTAAYKTVELDDLFDGQCTQHREVQMHESAGFKRLFKSISYLKGGVASGFHHVDTDGVYMPRLMIVKRLNRVIHVVQVPTQRESLNHGDAFVLDNGATIYAWFGDTSSPFEKQAANTYAENMENARCGKAKATLEIDDGFWSVLGGPGGIKSAEEVPALPEPEPIGEGLLYRLSDSSGDLRCSEVARGDLKRSMLQTSDVYICDVGPQLLVWIGEGASDLEKRSAMVTATKYLRFSNKPLTTPVAVVREGQAIGRPFNRILD